MKKQTEKSDVSVIGVDLGKQVFHLHGVDRSGQVVLRKRLSREKLLVLMANMPACRVGMEACGGAHHWARKFRDMGHDVRLMSPQFVKPYVKSNKNDGLDAEAICEAVSRPNMRFVPIKGMEQQDVQSLHRARSQAIAHRTAQGNQIRGLLMEYGIVVPQGAAALRSRLPEILEDAENGVSELFRELLFELYQELKRLHDRVVEYDAKIKALSEQSETCQLLMTIPGIGPLIATGLLAAVGNARVFRNGREMAAWLGLVPKQHSTGGKPRLLGISKRGDSYLRQLLIHGARAVLQFADRKEDRRSLWVVGLEHRRGRNVAAVALANKTVRTVWAVLTRGEAYQPQAA